MGDEGVETREQIGIREATDADLLSIVEIVNREIRESAFVWGEVPNTLEMRRDWLAHHRATGHPVFVAVEADGRVVGWSSLSAFRPASGYRFTAEVSVYVARDSHRRGLGRRLVAALHDAAPALELHTLVAVIDAENAASIRLFESFGYAHAGRIDEAGRKLGRWRSEVFLTKRVDANRDSLPDA